MSTRAVHSDQLQDYVYQELFQLDNITDATLQERYCAHKVCFERLIDQHSIYKDLLTRIKAEYEGCIEALERGQREAVYLSGKLAAAFLESETIRIIKKRADELDLKVGLLRIINQRLESPLKSSCMRRVSSKQKRSSHRTSANFLSPGSFPEWEESEGPSRSTILPNLTVEQLTDRTFLTKKAIETKPTAIYRPLAAALKLADLRSRVAEVKHEKETRFVPRENKNQLFNRLQEKEIIKEFLMNKREDLKLKIITTKLDISHQEKKPARGQIIFGKIAKVIKDTNQTMEKADVLLSILYRNITSTDQAHYLKNFKIDEMSEEQSEGQEIKRDEQYVEQGVRGELSSRSIGEDDDPTKDKESEFILEYIENFFELFEAGNIDDAVLMAAHSPKGVLRTMETLQKFQRYDDTHTGSSIYVSYWEALLPTVATGCKKPTEWETIECIKCVLNTGRKDLLTHWIAQDQLTLSEEAGRLIAEFCRCPDSCKCGLVGLAEAVFVNVAACKEVLACLLRQGRFHKAMEYSKTNKDLTRTDFVEAFQILPLTNDMLSFLGDECTQNRLLPLEEAEDLLSRVLVNDTCHRISQNK